MVEDIKKKQKEINIDVNRLMVFLEKEGKNPENSMETQTNCAYYFGYIQGMKDKHNGGSKKTALKILEAHEYMNKVSLRNMKVPEIKN